MQLTREQQLALTSDRHLAVLANAGSGKTAVLVQRYTQLLLDGVDVRDITAITFTRKAAGEMLQRVARRLDTMLQSLDYVEQWPQIKHVRERLNSARISTIHSFCARLLRDYPIEANVNPAFSELAEHEGIALKTEAAAAVLESWLDLAEDNAARRTAALEMFRKLGRKRVERYLQALLAVREDFNAVQELYEEQDNETIAQRAREQLIQEASELLTRMAPLLRETLFNIQRDDLTKAGVKQYDAARDALSAYTPLSADQELNSELLTENLTQLRAVADALFTQKRTLRSTVKRGVANEQLVPALEAELGKLLKATDELSGVIQHADADHDVVKQARTLISIGIDAWKHVDKNKDSEGQLDFDDLQLRARQLLQNPDVRTRLQRRLRHVMIDEFQDTNALQYAIAEALLAPGDEDQELIIARDRARLFIVGDPKQSIYGFRGSDVRVFEQARADVKQLNLGLRKLELLPGPITSRDGDSLNARPEENLGDIRLNASFRLLPAPAAFVNRVCGKHMLKRDSDFDIEYEDLVCARTGAIDIDAGSGAAGSWTTSQDSETAADGSDAGAEAVLGSVELLIATRRRRKFGEQSPNPEEPRDEVVDTEDNPEDSEESISEAELVARRIYHAVRGDRRLIVHEFNGKGEVPRPAEFGDVTVLARGRNGIAELTAALRRHDIPFILSGGRGYFETQELLDIRSVLLFLQNQANDAAFAAMLRSPFFGLRDLELYEISVAEGASLWDKFNAHAEQYTSGDILTPAFKRTHKILTELTPLAQRLTIPMLIRWILDRTAWRGMTAGHERHVQMEANLEKLLDLARSFEERGFNNLHDFARELDTLAKHSVAEGEADVSSGAGAVKVMTIHAAKGLEFPIVFLYKSSFRSMVPHAPLLNPELGLCFPAVVPIPSTAGTLEAEEVGPLFYVARRRQKLAELAEEKRVLYVALTRARDHLITSMTLETNDEGVAGRAEGFAAALLDALNITEGEALERGELRLRDTLPVLQDGHYSDKAVDYAVPIILELEDSLKTEAGVTTTESGSGPMLLTAPVQTHAEVEFYSASQLDLFKRNPAEYVRVYRLGLPPTEDQYWQTALGRGADPQGDQDAVLGTQAGSLIHTVLETLPLWIGSEDEVDELLHQEYVDRAIQATERSVNDALRERVVKETLAVGHNNFIREQKYRLRVEQAWQAELPFQLYIDEGKPNRTNAHGPLRAFMIGVLDVLFNFKDGQNEVWDWKSNRVLGREDMDDLRERYRTQMEVYLYFLMRRFPDQETYTARLLFTRRAAHSHNLDDWTISLTKSRAEMQELEAELMSLMREMRDSLF